MGTASSHTLDALDEEIILSVDDVSTVGVSITGTWSGTISFYTAADSSTWWPASFTILTNTGATGYTTTTNGLWQANVNARQYLKIKMTSYTSGSADISLYEK